MAGPANVAFDDVSIRCYVDGEEKGLYAATSFEAHEEFVQRSAKYQGDSIPKKDASFNGWRGSVNFELRSGFADPREMLKAYSKGVKDRTNTGRIVWLVSNVNTDGTRTTLRLDNLQLNSGRMATENERYKIPVNFEAEDGEES